MDDFIDVVIEDERWLGAGLTALAQRAAVATFAELGLQRDGFSICVMGCDDARIAALNADFRGKPTPTNVLSWPSEDLSSEVAGAAPALPQPFDGDQPWGLGDIAISYDTCMAEAGDNPPNDHITHLIIHGILHLLGYDHIRDADGDLMESLETRIMAGLGLPDPYA